jgi:hypothetical protein
LFGVAVVPGDDAKTSSIGVARFHREADAFISSVELVGILLIESNGWWHEFGTTEWKNTGKMRVGAGHIDVSSSRQETDYEKREVENCGRQPEPAASPKAPVARHHRAVQFSILYSGQAIPVAADV